MFLALDGRSFLLRFIDLLIDLIVVLDDGKISGAGTHDRLMATNRIYQED